ncbi:MAG: hypothetical protein DHS20C18_42810 [Saprospiraceae bacterium]|nr:MAG: hypothetical protein DHS20C18_42810 [Saprospiraceae bacterium]
MDFYDQLKFRAFNQSLAAILVATLIMLVSDIIEKNETLIYTLFGVLLTLFIFVFMHYGWYFLAALLFSGLYPSLLFILSIFYGEDLNISYAYFAFIVIILLSIEELWLKISLCVYIFIIQVSEIYYNRYYGSIIEKDIPLMDGLLILILPTIGVGILVLSQVSAIKNLYDKQKVINRELNDKNKELTKMVKQNESQNNLLAIIAHDLKGPAATFNNLTKNIAFLIKNEQPERLEKMAYGFEIAGTKLYYTISNLLNWVTSQRGDIISEKRMFLLPSLLEEIKESLHAQIQFKKVTIQISTEKEHALATDRNILRIILFNILNNAIKFSKTNDKIEIRTSRDSTFDTIAIVDHGVGIGPIMIEKIQSEEIISVQGTHHEKGHGIGLKICFALIQHIKGKITIESEIGQGSVFTVYVPR